MMVIIYPFIQELYQFLFVRLSLIDLDQVMIEEFIKKGQILLAYNIVSPKIVNECTKAEKRIVCFFPSRTTPATLVHYLSITTLCL